MTATKRIQKMLNPGHISRVIRGKIKWHWGVLSALLGLGENCDRSRLECFRGIHTGGTGFLVGNGPSVRPGDLERLNNEITFCCNRFYLAYSRLTFRPTYTVSADIGMIEDFGEEIVSKSEGEVFLVARERPRISGEFTWVGSKYDAPPLVFSRKIYHHIAIGGSTLIAALQLGYFMGIRHFVLYGVDHQFNYDAIGEDQRTPFRTATGEGNHFIAHYRSGKPWCPPDVGRINHSIQWADRRLRKEGGSLVNATRGGHLELLPRQNLDDVLATPGV